MSRRGIYLICLLFSLPLALVVAEICHYSRNTLNENGRWVSAKPLMQIPLMGAHHFVFTRNALARNRLNMNAWHGYNELYFDRPLRPGSIELSFRLDEQAHLSVIFGRTAEDFLGVRLSRHPGFPSMFFRGERSGGFTDKSPIEQVELDAAWHRARIEARDGRWLVSLDGSTVARLEQDDVSAGLVGFRNGFSRVEVDDVRLTDAAGKLLIEESFRHRRGYWRTFLASFVAVYLALLLVAWVTSRGSHDGDAKPAHWVILVALVATFGSLLLLGFDTHVWSRTYLYEERYPNAGKTSPALLARLETWRRELFGTEVETVIDPPGETVARTLTRWDLTTPFIWPGPRTWNHFAAYTSNAPGEPRYLTVERLRALDPEARAIRLAFVGASQTVGVGAETVGDALVSRIHHSLSDSVDADPMDADPMDAVSVDADSVDGEVELRAFNLAVAGARAPFLLADFERQWIALAPDVVIVNLSFNDRDVPRFETALRRFVELDRSHGIETLLVVEPLSPDKQDLGVRQRHEVVRAVGRSEGVPVLDLEAHMADPSVYDSGFVWWDQVHMTSYGQRLAAAWLAEQIEPYLRDLPRNGRSTP